MFGARYNFFFLRGEKVGRDSFSLAFNFNAYSRKKDIVNRHARLLDTVALPYTSTQHLLSSPQSSATFPFTTSLQPCS